MEDRANPGPAPTARSSSASPARDAALLFLAAAAVYFVSAPRIVNGDGLGYLKSVAEGAPPPPGHVLYLALLDGLALLLHRTSPLALLEPARALSALAGALAVATFYLLARELGLGRRAACVGAVGLAVSWGLWQEADDVETYAPALAALEAAVLFALRARRTRRAREAAGAGLAAAAAILLHVANVLAVPLLAWLLARRQRQDRPPFQLLLVAALAAAIGGLTPIAYLAWGVLHLRAATGPGGLLAWLLGANHGFRYPLHLYTPAVALWGLARTFAYAPFPVDAPMFLVVIESAGAFVALAAIVWLLRSPPPARIGSAGALLWAAPIAALGVLYYGSDTERWIFLLPLAWLWIAHTPAMPPRAVAALAALLAVWNLSVEVLPHALHSPTREAAERAGGLVADGDLVVGPGHGWDEYVGFYERKDVRVLPLAYFAGARGSAPAALAEIDGEIDRALARGAHVWAARIFEPSGPRADDRPDGWKELALFGLDRASIERHLRARYRVPDGGGPFVLLLRAGAAPRSTPSER